MTDVVSGITLKDLERLQGYVREETKSPYETIRLRNENHLLILYTSGKLVIQGKNNPFSNKVQHKKKEVILPPQLKVCIGSDETLKGDTFGGIVVCAAYFSEDEVDLKDSKSYTDAHIQELASSLLERYPDRFASKVLTPLEYNALYLEVRSQTALLNLLHQEVGSALKKKFQEVHVVDKYPGCSVGDYQVEKGESHYVSVAAASIIARYYAILQFEELSKQAGFRLPKGSTHVKEAVVQLKESSLGIQQFAKMHFSTITPR